MKNYSDESDYDHEDIYFSNSQHDLPSRLSVYHECHNSNRVPGRSAAIFVPAVLRRGLSPFALLSGRTLMPPKELRERISTGFIVTRFNENFRSLGEL